MDYLLIGGVAIAVAIVLIILLNGNGKNKKDSSGSQETKNSNKNLNTKKEDVFKFMEFDRIYNNMIIQNNGSRFTMAIRCKGINYDLMSEVEQMAVEQGFITFLNTLKYPIQLYVQAQNVDLKSVVKDYKKNIEGLYKEYAEYDNMISDKTSILDTNQEEIDEILVEKNRIQNVYEYAYDIISLVEKMSVNKNLLQRNFYVLVSYSKSDIVGSEKFTKEEVNEMCYTELYTRCNSIIGALNSCSVTGKVLTSNELADLLYVAYNRDDKSLMSVRDALESGYYRLYSTTEDAFVRKERILKEAIDNQARLKAVKSIRKALDRDKHQTETMIKLETEEQITHEASELIKNEDMDPEIRDYAYSDVINDYRELKKEYQPIIEKEKEELKIELEEEEKERQKKYDESELKVHNEKIENAEQEYRNDLKEEKRKIEEILEKNDESDDDSIV